MTDKDSLVAYLQAQINAAALIVNSGKTAAKFTVLIELPVEQLVSKYINELKNDVLFTVSRIREAPDRIHADNIPRCINGYFQVKIWSLDKSFVDGNALREMAFSELKRIFVASYSYPFFSVQDEDRKLGKQQIFNSVFTVLKVTES